MIPVSPVRSARSELDQIKKEGREEWLRQREQKGSSPTLEEIRAKSGEDRLKLRHQHTRENSRDPQDRSAERDQEAKPKDLSRFEIAQKPTNNGVSRAPNGRAGQLIGFFAVSDIACARLIRCLHAFQQNAIAQARRIFAHHVSKFVRSLRGFLSLAVTKVHISYVLTDCA